jgi:hypothetical protein
VNKLFSKTVLKQRGILSLKEVKRVAFRSDSSFQPEIVASVFGKVDDHEVKRIVTVMQRCYERLSPHNVDMVDLYVFDRWFRVEAFLTEESRRLKVASSSFGESFFSFHDAWRGIPRIIICLERMKKLSALAQKGGVHHEVGHSVLHGSPLYYVFGVPPALGDLAKRFKLSRRYVTDMLYLISIAVKDYEVSRLLRKHGYVKDQIAFAKQMLAPTESDKTSWELSKGKPEAEALCLTSYLKLIGCVTPFLADETLGKKLHRHLRNNFSFLPKEYSRKLLEQMPKIFRQLNLDTTGNVNKLANLTVENIVKPLLASAQ